MSKPEEGNWRRGSYSRISKFHCMRRIHFFELALIFLFSLILVDTVSTLNDFLRPFIFFRHDFRNYCRQRLPDGKRKYIWMSNIMRRAIYRQHLGPTSISSNAFSTSYNAPSQQSTKFEAVFVFLHCSWKWDNCGPATSFSFSDYFYF